MGRGRDERWKIISTRIRSADHSELVGREGWDGQLGCECILFSSPTEVQVSYWRGRVISTNVRRSLKCCGLPEEPSSSPATDMSTVSASCPPLSVFLWLPLCNSNHIIPSSAYVSSPKLIRHRVLHLSSVILPPTLDPRIYPPPSHWHSHPSAMARW